MSVRPALRKLRLSDLGEFGLIDLVKKQTGRPPFVVRGIGDDAAVVPFSSKRHLLLTADMLVEGVHFTRDMPARGIGHKAVAAGISDIAAMGGEAKYAVVSLGAPPACPWPFVSRLYQGMEATAKRFHVGIVGGDTVRSGRIIVNVALAGEARRNQIVYRDGAREGDHIFVTGPLGRSLSSGRHLRFTPRMVQARHLVRHSKPTAMIDISDGLAADLGHILSESRVGAVIEERLVPRRRGARLRDALYDGEDFELLFTLPPAKARALLGQKKRGFSFYRIGEIVGKGEGLQLRTVKGGLRPLDIRGYVHF